MVEIFSLKFFSLVLRSSASRRERGVQLGQPNMGETPWRIHGTDMASMGLICMVYPIYIYTIKATIHAAKYKHIPVPWMVCETVEDFPCGKSKHNSHQRKKSSKGFHRGKPWRRNEVEISMPFLEMMIFRFQKGSFPKNTSFGKPHFPKMILEIYYTSLAIYI